MRNRFLGTVIDSRRGWPAFDERVPVIEANGLCQCSPWQMVGNPDEQNNQKTVERPCNRTDRK